MDFSGNISSIVYKREVTTDLGEISLDSNMLNVLMLLDGKKNIGTIANSLNITLSAMKEILQRLDKLNLIATESDSVPVLSKDFITNLSKQLSIAMGPMAQIVLEDELQRIGYTIDSIPSHKAPELVDALSVEISREEKKLAFQQAMISLIKKL